MKQKPPGTYTQLPSGAYRWTIYTGERVVKDGKLKRVRESSTARTLLLAKEAARQAAKAAERRTTTGERSFRGITTGEWMTYYLDTCDERLAASTMHEYRQIATQWIVSAIGHVPLAKLDVHDVEHMLDRMRRSDGTPLSKTRRSHAREVLAGALREAERRRLVDRNAARLARAPEGRKGSKMRPPSPAEARKALEIAATIGPTEHLFTRLALITGARRGSLIALRWSDVDWTAGTLTVARSITDRSRVWEEKETKTGQVAVVPLDAVTLGMLRAQRERFGIPRRSAWIIADDPNVPWRAHFATDTWNRIASAAGLTCRLHDLRHFVATQIIAGGLSANVAAERLTHGDASITQRVYASGTDEGQQAATVLLAGLIDHNDKEK